MPAIVSSAKVTETVERWHAAMIEKGAELMAGERLPKACPTARTEPEPRGLSTSRYVQLLRHVLVCEGCDHVFTSCTYYVLSSIAYGLQRAYASFALLS